MASKTAVTMYRRGIRKDNMGTRRKRDLRNYGSTKPFAVHTADADANAPAAQVSTKAE